MLAGTHEPVFLGEVYQNTVAIAPKAAPADAGS
jgi:hypothetical protein